MFKETFLIKSNFITATFSLFIEEPYFFLIALVLLGATLMFLLNIMDTKRILINNLSGIKLSILLLLMRSVPILILLSIIYPLIFLHVLSGVLNSDINNILLFISFIFLAEKVPFLLELLEKTDKWGNSEKIRLVFIFLSSISLLMFFTYDVHLSQLLMGSFVVYCMDSDIGSVNKPRSPLTPPTPLTPLTPPPSEIEPPQRGEGGGGGFATLAKDLLLSRPLL